MDFTGEKIYQCSFDPHAYLASFCSLGSQSESLLRFKLRKFAETFGPGGISGDNLIDIGSGPCIYQLLSACESFCHIVASDFTNQNCQEIEKWIKDDPEAFDWSEVVKIVCELEGKSREKWEEKQSKLRSRLEKVLKCDVMKSNPLDPVTVPPADCLIAALCLETASPDLEAFVKAIKNVTTLLRPGGHLVAIVALGDSFYKVGEKSFFALPLDEATVRSAVTQAGYTITDAEVFDVPNKATRAAIADTYANLFLVARKEASSETH